MHICRNTRTSFKLFKTLSIHSEVIKVIELYVKCETQAKFSLRRPLTILTHVMSTTHSFIYLFVICVCRVTTKYHNNHVFSLCSVSAGVGRTGCFIVMEAMLERMNHEKSVDIYGHVTCMRAQRNYMVQTEDQYIFIHEALLEAAICGNTEVAARNLYAHLQKLTQIPAGETVTTMELEFKVGAF